MEFNKLKHAVQKRFDEMIKNQDRLFLTNVGSDELWEHYLNSWPEGTNPIHKTRREHDCSACKQFIRNYGNIVTIQENQLISIWDTSKIESPYHEVAKAMSTLVKSASIKSVFATDLLKLGVDKNRQLLEDGTVLTWEHFYYELPNSYKDRSGKSINAIQGKSKELKDMFERTMVELTIDAGSILLELIKQGSLYRGEECKENLEKFYFYKIVYSKIANEVKDNWCWKNYFENPVCGIRNTAIGTLLIDLSKNVDLDVAVTKFEKIMAPANYKRPKTLFTKKMVEDAENKIEELGFTNSLGRRFAKMNDITVNNLLFVNRDAKKKLKSSVFDDLKEDVPVNAKKFDKVEEISIEDFIKNILPTTTNIDLMIENKHTGNFMSLVAPQDSEAPTMFKWDNNFSWAYNGDIADSMKQNVKNAGGDVEGVIRFSIQWNTDEYNPNDFDAHCIEPGRNLIDYRRKVNRITLGNLDTDITNPVRGKPAVENITWPFIDKMLEGTYYFLVHNYAHRGGHTGFSAEIEYDGQIHSYEYSKELKSNEKVLVAEIDFNKVNGIKFVKSLDSSLSSKEFWGVKTNTFQKVSVCMFSPNYWDNQDAIGNKHYFFLFDGCKNQTTPRGFFNEFLNEELTAHRKVFEALGSKMRVEDSEEQLSGIGFSSTQRNSVLAKIEGSFTRIIKITF